MNNNNKAAVLIVGAGPTGLVLALWLTKLGITVRIIDKNEHAGQTSRALIIQAHTLELYNQIGIAEEVIASGIKLEHIEFLKDGCSIKKANISEVGATLSPYPFVLSFPQDDHEKLLISHLNKMGIEVERQTELVSFQQTAEKVTAIISAQGQQETAEFAYLCGCDGARSTTREQLQIKFPGETYNQVFFVADVASPTEIINGLSIGISETDFTLAFPVRSSKTIRLIGVVPPEHAQDETITFENVQTSVARNSHVNVTAVNWFSTYRVHHRVVPKFHIGRVFLSGDAAHIHSPVGGQGMNTGIGDAINLAWKIAAVLNDQCSAKLLDTYELERLPFAKQLVSTTDRMFQVINSRSWVGATWRKFVFPHIVPQIFNYSVLSQLFFKFVSQIRVNYRQSPLSIKGKGKVRAGDRLPWVPYENVDNYTALKTIDWQVHVYGTASKTLGEALQAMNIPLHEFAWSKAAQEKHLLEHAAYLVRPDGYIAVVDVSADAGLIKQMWDGLR